MDKQVKKKGGRPPKNVKRVSLVIMRLTVGERLVLEQKSKKSGMTISDFIRHAFMSSRIVTRLGTQELQVHRVLAGMANNLNQLTKKAHQMGLLVIARSCQELMAEIDKQMKRLNEL